MDDEYIEARIARSIAIEEAHRKMDGGDYKLLVDAIEVNDEKTDDREKPTIVRADSDPDPDGDKTIVDAIDLFIRHHWELLRDWIAHKGLVPGGVFWTDLDDLIRTASANHRYADLADRLKELKALANLSMKKLFGPTRVEYYNRLLKEINWIIDKRLNFYPLAMPLNIVGEYIV